MQNIWVATSENVPSGVCAHLRFRSDCANQNLSSLGAFWLPKDAKFLHVDNKDSDQTVWMRRLIWVFVGSTCQRVHFSHVVALIMAMFLELFLYDRKMSFFSKSQQLYVSLFEKQWLLWDNDSLLSRNFCGHFSKSEKKYAHTKANYDHCVVVWRQRIITLGYKTKPRNDQWYRKMNVMWLKVIRD